MPVFLIENLITRERRIIVAPREKTVMHHLLKKTFTVKSLSGIKAVDAMKENLPMEDLREEKEADIYHHKEGCSAEPWTPISGPGCKCTKLDLP